jgi:hypothetical protein
MNSKKPSANIFRHIADALNQARELSDYHHRKRRPPRTDEVWDRAAEKPEPNLEPKKRNK